MKIVKTEYAVELNNNKGFVKQIDVFNDYEEACEFVTNYNKPLDMEEYLNIIFIDYDEDGNEVDFGTI